MSNRQTGHTGRGGGLGAPGTTGASGARDPLGAPGSTGASMTTMGAPGYDPTEYSAGGGGQQQLHRPVADVETGHQQQQHRPAADVGTGHQQQQHRPAADVGTGHQQQQHRPAADVGTGQQQQHRPTAADVGTGLGYTYGTAGSMGQTGTGYHAGVHVPHSTGMTGTYGTGGGLDTKDFGSAGVGDIGEGFDTGMGERTHGAGEERGGHIGLTSETVIIETVDDVGGGVGNDTREIDEWARGIGGDQKGGTLGDSNTGGARQRQGNRRG